MVLCDYLSHSDDNMVRCLLDPNPHMGHLAWADAFVITADSISMLSEACSTGYCYVMNYKFLTNRAVIIIILNFPSKIWCCRKPVYVIGTERCRWKFTDFHRSLEDRGAVRRFTGRENVSSYCSFLLIELNQEELIFFCLYWLEGLAY